VRRLIVNADDFGLTPGVSRGILEAHRRGIVTSTTVIVNRAIEPALLDELRESPLGVGLHLNLTLGPPVAPAVEVASLLDAGGAFHRDPARQAAEGEPAEIARELRAQVARFVRLLGRKPTHLDSHHHVGRRPPVRGALFDLAEELGVPVRAQDDDTRRVARERALRSPDHFFGESGPDPYWSAARLLAQLAALPEGISEFMTHPGYFDAELGSSRYGPQREVELAGLTDPAVREAVTAHGIALCHFGDL
jgi:predicted glycoside hydrolase/deacetylase ChbG (UPF0249 family)